MRYFREHKKEDWVSRINNKDWNADAVGLMLFILLTFGFYD